MEGFSIRPATVDDLAAVLAIEKEVHVAPWAQDGFASELVKPYSRFWLLTDDETDAQVAAYIVFWVVSEECRILNLAVALGFRGMGLAQNLVRSAVRDAMTEGVKRAELEVRKSNQPAIDLYQKLGFTIIQVRKSFYSNGEDAYIMELLLEGERSDF